MRKLFHKLDRTIASGLRSADGLEREFKDETKLRVRIWHARVSVRQPNTIHQQTHHSHRDEGDHKIPSGKRRNCLGRPGS